MIWRLTYCNKEGVQARLDIIKGSSTPVEVIEGTATPFALNYKMDKPDKSGFFMTSSADISIFETTSFNIDGLKTSSETEIKVEHYIDNILDWSGFVIPDFFSKTIGSPATVEMVASDRLATLKGVTLTDLNQYTSMRDLAVACLAHTGLSLPLYTLADFGNDGQTNAFFKSLGLSSRLSDTKGRNISCYDILKSILVASNSKLVQQDGAWHIVNKWQHEQGVGNLFSNLTSSTPYSEQTINFSDVHVGGRRSIIPVAAITGVYHEFGGGRSYPDNFDFRDFELIPEFNFPDWTKGGTFNVNRGNKEIIGYSFDGQMQFGANTVDNYFFNSNVFNTSNYLQMDGIPVPYATGQIEVVLDLNATAQTVSPFLTNVTAVRIAVGAVKDGSPTIWLNESGIFAEDNAVIHNLNFERGATHQAQTKGFNLKGVINNPEGYSIIMRIYGSRDGDEDNRRQIAIHFARIEFKNTQDAPKGTIYKRRQGTDFTKEHDIDTTIFGDYMQKGLDGYFYEYPFDDTSSLYRTAGTLTQPLWTAPNDTEQLPLLQHVTRQKARMFSLAHNMISARINVSSFKPLNIFIDCNSERHVVVSATYDFLRSEVEVELEQIASTTLNVRDFIYSYFGDGESGISSVGGVSGGGGGSTGGGLTPEQLEILSWWKKDPDNPDTIFTEMNAYSKLELSAYGVGDGEGGGGDGGSDYERLDTWASYDSSKAGWVLSAFLGNDLNVRVADIDGRVTNLENSAGGGSVTSVGISVPTGLSVSNSPITSSGVIAIGLQTGYSIPTTAKQGQWDTAYGWGDFRELGLGADYIILDLDDQKNNSIGFTASSTANLTMPYGGVFRFGSGASYVQLYGEYRDKQDLHFRRNRNGIFDDWRKLWHDGDFTSTEITNWREVRTWWQNVGQYLKRDATNQALYTDENFYSTKELSAYGIDSGGGSGGGIIETVYGYGNLGQTFNNSILTDTFNAYTINQINTRLVAVESGSATSINTTGTGNAITSISKAGSVITANKDLAFLETSIFNTHNNDNVRHITGAERTKWDTVVTDFAGLEIGGRNYLTYEYLSSQYSHIVEWGGGLSTLFNSQGAPNNDLLELYAKGEQLTFRCYIVNEGETPVSVHIGWYNDPAGGNRQHSTNQIAPGNEGWATVTFTSSDYNPGRVAIRGNADTGISKATFSKLKLEKGNKATDWTPAPEDQVSDWLTTDVNSFSFIKNKPTTLSQFNDNIGVASHIANTSNPHSVTKAQVGLGNVDNTADSAKNVLSATKLQTSRTIWGQSFDGTGDVTGELSGVGNIISTTGGFYLSDSLTNPYLRLTNSGVNFYVQASSNTRLQIGTTTSNALQIHDNGSIGVGTGSGSLAYKLDVNGTGRFRGALTAEVSVTSPKVIFNAAGWSMEQVGSELQMKHNNILKMRFTSAGSIVATEEITAFG